MSDLGNMTEGGMFLPSEPTVDGLMKMLGGNVGGWNEQGENIQSAVAEKNRKEKEDLLKAYVSTFSTASGRRVLEDILNMTLRRSPYTDGAKIENMEQLGISVVERKGQNGLAIAIFAKIVSGQNIKAAPAAEKSKSKKS